MKLYIFPDPADSVSVFNPDNFTSQIGQPDTHSSGRPGQSFTIPSSIPDQNGYNLSISHSGKVKVVQRGILFTESSPIFPDAMISVDDFKLQDEKVCPEIPPTPIPIPPTNPAMDPYGIVIEVFNEKKFDLTTKEGCGQFTEECCKRMHNRISADYGHLKKIPPQNNYNGHAVDAVHLLHPVGTTLAGIYDIILSSESVDAAPAFNKTSQNENPNLWYYPA